MLIYEVPSREKNNSKSGAVRRKTNLLVRQILIGWIYRRIGFLKRGKKKQIKPLAAILRFLDFSIPRYRHFERSREIFLALCCFLLLSLKISSFPLSHMERYTSMQERSLHFGRDDDTGIAIYKHIRCTLRGIDPFPHTVISSAARNLSCTPLFLAPFAKGFPFSAISHRAIYQVCKKDPSTSLSMTIREWCF